MNRAVRVPGVGSRRMPFALAVVAITAADENDASRSTTYAAREAFAVSVELGITEADRGTRTGTVKARARLGVALAAYEAGFFLLDVVEVDSKVGLTSREWSLLWALAVETDAQALFTLGLSQAERDVMDVMATELRMVIHSGDADIAGDAAADDMAAVGVPAADGNAASAHRNGQIHDDAPTVPKET